MKKTIALLACILSAVTALWAAPEARASAVSQEIIPLSSPLYADMDALYLVLGKGTPSNARPWSKTEAGLILSRIDRAPLSAAETRLYDSIAAAIAPGLKFKVGDGFEAGVSVDLNFEAYAHRNADYDLETDWIYGFERRKPMAKLSLDFSIKDFFYTYCDLQYGRNRFNYQDTFVDVSAAYPEGIGAIVAQGVSATIVTHSAIYSQLFLTNILEHSYDFDFQWPKRAIAAIGGQNWNLSFSRDKVSWGNGHSGNFIVDDHTDYQDFMRATAFSDLFKYDWLNIFFETNPSQGEAADTKFRMLMAHRLEFRILKKITFAVSENVMYQNDVFDLKYLNPAFIYHNLNDRSMFNAIAHAEIDYNAAKGLNFYAQFVMDQARAPNESAAQADSMGYMGGIEYAALVGPGSLSSSLEFTQTDPLLYRRDGVDFLMFRKYFTHGNPAGPGYVLSLDYIGHQHGGDAQVLQWDTGYRIPGVGSVGLTLFGMRHGAMDIFTSHNIGGDNDGAANYEGATPSGDAIGETFVASLSGNYEIPRLVRWAEAPLWAQLDFIAKRTYTKSTDTYSGESSDLQLTVGCSLKL